MKYWISVLFISFALVGNSQAAVVAVVDSGTDFEHVKLKGNAWVNSAEVAANRVDDDGNTLVDDINGWNFVDGYGRVFFREHLPDINPIVYPLFKVIAHQQAGIITEEENQFFKDNFAELPDTQRQAMANHLNYFGQYIHGTHVAGIVTQVNPNAQILAARVFADETAPIYRTAAFEDYNRPQGMMDWLYKLLAVLANGNFQQVGGYLGAQDVDVANYSLGMSISAIAKQVLILGGNAEPTEAEIAAEAKRLYAQFEPEGRKWMELAPNTLFVLASGNDGNDNDILPGFPSNIRIKNAISVAASQGYEKLATFSNFGLTTVDVAAPGVAIMSTVSSLDNKAELPLSGTSMAAPFVTGVASLVKDANDELTPEQMRKILMETVDVKDWLKNKVISGGVVNAARAQRAAELSAEMDLDAAIASARAEVADRAVDEFGPQNLKGGVEASDLLKAAGQEFVF